jgi:hypothetical protein
MNINEIIKSFFKIPFLIETFLYKDKINFD